MGGIMGKLTLSLKVGTKKITSRCKSQSVRNIILLSRYSMSVKCQYSIIKLIDIMDSSILLCIQG